ncbi:hypothetical protein [Tenggerimyces flavus]|uniref:Uncharacterized protein n=1 Tax=Tenggerimyces flavus TaxID=1708749 RepID=A0ABV7YLV6_9ACTN|nr:hypothetical protein [Tenggerimyces flavus]MBM7790039.1 hypothetical protein [Tenggerimyces flavus]
MIVAPSQVPGGILERFDDARRRGATLLALEAGDREVRSLAHESLTVLDAEPKVFDHDALWLPATDRPDRLIVPDAPGFGFETAQHLVSLAAGEQAAPVGRRRGFRDKLGRLLDRISGDSVVDHSLAGR